MADAAGDGAEVGDGYGGADAAAAFAEQDEAVAGSECRLAWFVGGGGFGGFFVCRVCLAWVGSGFCGAGGGDFGVSPGVDGGIQGLHFGSVFSDGGSGGGGDGPADAGVGCRYRV